MKIELNNKEALVAIHHMNVPEFKKKYPQFKKEVSKKNKMVTVAEVLYDGVQAVDYCKCHPEDDFVRREGAMRALSKVLMIHPELKKKDNKTLRRSIHERMFRSEPSPYAQLLSLIRGKPDLARKLHELGVNELKKTTVELS